MITERFPEQEALIPFYREKWRNIALSTERIDRAIVSEVIFQQIAQLNHALEEVMNTAIEQDDTLSSALDTHIAEHSRQHFACAVKVFSKPDQEAFWAKL